MPLFALPPNPREVPLEALAGYLLRPMTRATLQIACLLAALATTLGAAAPVLGQEVVPRPETTAQQQAAGPQQAERPRQVDPAVRYAVQLRASEVESEIDGLLDSLQQEGFPAYKASADVRGTMYHRLRMGPFLSPEDARQLVAFAGIEDVWVVEADDEAQRTASRFACQALPMRGRETYAYLGRYQPFLALMQRTRPARGSLLPSELHLFVPGRPTPTRIDDVTGFLEAEGGLELGKAARVYVNPARKSRETIQQELRLFSQEYGLSHYVVSNGLALYNDDRVARFTLLGTYHFAQDTVLVYPQSGFDYAGFGDTRRRFTGSVAPEGRFRRGNVRAERVPDREAFTWSSDYVTVFGRPADERGGVADVCALFYEPQQPYEESIMREARGR